MVVFLDKIAVNIVGEGKIKKNDASSCPILSKLLILNASGLFFFLN